MGPSIKKSMNRVKSKGAKPNYKPGAGKRAAPVARGGRPMRGATKGSGINKLR